jgi:hypothetical protein
MWSDGLFRLLYEFYKKGCGHHHPLDYVIFKDHYQVALNKCSFKKQYSTLCAQILYHPCMNEKGCLLFAKTHQQLQHDYQLLSCP